VFWENGVVRRGSFVVNMWWSPGKRGDIDGRYLVAKNGTPVSSIFFVGRN
jgi:hypothetical protein